MNFLTNAYNIFWSESIWLPPGYTWESFSPQNTDLKLPDSRDLRIYPFLIAAFFMFLNRFILRPVVFLPVWQYFTAKLAFKPDNNDVLDSIYTKYYGRPPKAEVATAAEDLGWDGRKLSRFIRRNAKYWRDLNKFIDCSWQLVYYVSYLAFGCYVLYDKEWFYDIRYCWLDFPRHAISDDMWWYYMIPLGFYYSQVVFDLTGSNKRKDSTQMLVHHFATILLISFSFTLNMLRIGCLILFVHECADIPLLLAKICGYIGKKKYMDPLFVVFILLWVVTRLGIFPFKLVKSTLFEAHVIADMFFPVYYIFNGLLLMIFCMHLIWTFYILQIVVNIIKTKKISDVRSSDEEETEDEKSK